MTAGHSHSFGEEKTRAGEQRTILVIAVTAVMMVVEIVAGVVFGSMALCIPPATSGPFQA